jgi:ADP-ribose pyrophosphatase YjhB (NUDIX family)
MSPERTADAAAAAPIPAVSVALVRGTRILLVKRRYAPSRGLYAFPGGRVEPGETLEAAARRELLEETGLHAGLLSPVAEMIVGPSAGDPPVRSGETPVRYRLHVFSAPHIGGEPVSADDAEEALFVTLAELKALPLTGNVGEIAAALLAAEAGRRGAAS